MNKQCKKCKQDKSILDFYKAKSNKDGLTSLCKPCEIIHKNTPKRRKSKKNYFIKSEYGLDNSQYNHMLAQQDNCCAICKIHRSKLKINLAVDHCHLTGKVRGLLCGKCNRAIGLLKDSIENILSALNYLNN